MKYDDSRPIGRSEAETMFNSENPDAICEALIRVALHDPDPLWSQMVVLRFVAHDDSEVRGLAATCLGHIARIHRRMDLGIVVPILSKLAEDPLVGGRAEDALDDIRTYMKSGAA